MEKISAGIVWDLWGGSFMKWTVRPASGASGGILLMWDKCVVECIEEVMDTFSICCKFKSIMDRFVWAFSGVYGPNVDSKRHSLWEELARVFSWKHLVTSGETSVLLPF